MWRLRFPQKHFITLTTNLTDLCIQYNCSKVVLQFTAMVQKTLKSLVKKFPTKLKSISEYYLNLSIRLSSLSLLSFFLFLHSPKVSKMKSFLGKAKTCGNSQIPERNHPNGGAKKYFHEWKFSFDKCRSSWEYSFPLFSWIDKIKRSYSLVAVWPDG